MSMLSTTILLTNRKFKQTLLLQCILLVVGIWHTKLKKRIRDGGRGA